MLILGGGRRARKFWPVSRGFTERFGVPVLHLVPARASVRSFASHYAG